MQYSQEHLKTMVYAKFGGQTECIMGNWKIENNLTLFCFSRDQANAAAAERSAVEIKLLQDRVGRYHVFIFGDFKKIINVMVDFQGDAKEFNKYIRESGYWSLVSWGILNWKKN